MKRLIIFLILAAATISGCGGGGTASDAPSSTVTPAAKFTVAELAGNSIYATTPSNGTGTFNTIAFSSNGTVTEYLNMSTTSTSSASATLSGSYTIDSNGVLTITLNGTTPLVAWKIVSTVDSYGSYSVRTSYSNTLTERWFYNQAIGASQALACATGAAIPTSSASTFTASGIAGKQLGAVVQGGASAYVDVFNSDGSLSEGLPGTTPVPINGTWSIAGDVITTNLPDGTYKVLTYTLISDDTVNSIWKMRRTYPDNATELVWFFYNPTTGVSQAQAFVAAGGNK